MAFHQQLVSRLAQKLLLRTMATFSILMSVVSPILADEPGSGYQLGRGYKLGNSGIRLGGYASARVNGFGDAPWNFEVSDISLFVSWNKGSKLSFFSELELEDPLDAGQYHGLSTHDAHFVLERLYVDYLFNDQLTVRIGKMLTPVGQWNTIHADPLVWTTTRPVVTENLFSKHMTGIMVHGTLPLGEQSIDYAVYGDYSSILDPRHEVHAIADFENALGLRLRYNISDDLQLGFSYTDFALRDTPAVRHHLLGLDLAWTYQRLSVTSEIVYRNNDLNVNAWQGYIQGVGALSDHFYAVGRYEFFDQDKNQFGQVGVFGLAYHPSPPLIWKLEYRYGEHNRILAPDGLFTSFSVLF